MVIEIKSDFFGETLQTSLRDVWLQKMMTASEAEPKLPTGPQLQLPVFEQIRCILLH